jgi:hypothetical protein
VGRPVADPAPDVQGPAQRPLSSTGLFELFCSVFMPAHQHSDQQVADRPTNREAAGKTKRSAANTGARSSSDNESGSGCDGESGERFVSDELLQMPSSPGRPVRGLLRRIDATGSLRKHLV